MTISASQILASSAGKALDAAADKALDSAGKAKEKIVDPALDTLAAHRELQIILLVAIAIALIIAVGLIVGKFGTRLAASIANRIVPEKIREVYMKVVAPNKGLAAIVLTFLVAELVIVFLPIIKVSKYQVLEISVSLALTISISWLASKSFSQFFDAYLLDVAYKAGRKVNSEFLFLAKFIANAGIIIVAAITFAQTHQINVIGLIASLGIGGLAVAFAAQKTLEQFLGGVVLYIDRPFVVDDYIGLPDGTFGRVEAIGLRSTKIRTSGKGTLMIVPNNSLTQANIENYTGAKKVMTMVYLNFYRDIPHEERALIRQVILESTNDIFGIDWRSTDVTFRELKYNGTKGKGKTQAQITFFILGSGDVSMELRRQLLDIANQNITQQLKEYGIAFDIEEQPIYVDSPITI